MVFRPNFGLVFLLHACVLDGGIFRPAVCPSSTWAALGRKRAACAADARRRHLPPSASAWDERSHPANSALFPRCPDAAMNRSAPLSQSRPTASPGMPCNHFTITCGGCQFAVPPARVALPDQSRHAGSRTAYLPRSAHRRTRPQPQIPLSHPRPAYSFFIATASAAPRGAGPRPKSAQRRIGYSGSGIGCRLRLSTSPPKNRRGDQAIPLPPCGPDAQRRAAHRPSRGRAQRRPEFRCPPAPVP